MAARTMWKAEVSFGDVRVPVRLYAAVEDRNVHFRLLHSDDLAPVTQQMVDPSDDEAVPKEEVRRGVEVEKGVFVVLTDEERAALEPEASREIAVLQVLARSQLDERWFDRPYYLGPDGDDEAYFALVQALESKDWLAIARWVMRKKRYAGALYGADGYLRLETLRFADEIVALDRLVPAKGREPDKREIELAEQLIGTLEDRFDADEFNDEYRDRVMQLIRDKQRGRKPKLPKAAAPRARKGSLRDSLEASLKAANG
jgi:DNA end-binding protein Ku